MSSIRLFFYFMVLFYSTSLEGQKNFFLDASANYSYFSTSTEDDIRGFGDFISSYGANAGATLYFTKSISNAIFGIDANYQYDRYISSRKFDLFDTKRPFDLYTISAGVNIGYKWESDAILDYQWEFILKGGVILNSFVEQKIESDHFQILTTSPYGQYAEAQIHLTNYDNGNGFYLGFKYWLNHEIETNIDPVFSINSHKFDLPSGFMTFKLGYRVGLF